MLKGSGQGNKLATLFDGYLGMNPSSADYSTYHQNNDWTDNVTRNGNMQHYGINVQGGDDIAKYSISLSYDNQKGVVEETGFPYQFRCLPDQDADLGHGHLLYELELYASGRRRERYDRSPLSGVNQSSFLGGLQLYRRRNAAHEYVERRGRTGGIQSVGFVGECGEHQ